MTASKRFVLLSSLFQLGLLAGLGPWMLTARGEAFRALDYGVAFAYYLYLTALLGIFHAVAVRRLGRATLFAAEVFTSFWLVASAVVSARFGVHLDHPVVLGIFRRRDLNYGLDPSGTDVALAAAVAATLLIVHGALFRYCERRERHAPGPAPKAPSLPLRIGRTACVLLLAAVYGALLYAGQPEESAYVVPEQAPPGLRVRETLLLSPLLNDRPLPAPRLSPGASR
jgi:hypothetical protein